jgi:hypothetical protein
MTPDATRVYPTDREHLWVLCDLRETDGARFVHEARALFRERSDLAGFGPDHMVVLLLPESPPSEHAE